MNVSGEPLLAPGTGLKSLWDTSRFSTRRTQLDSGDVQLYGFARQALIAGMRTLAPGSVLAPAFICDTAVEPLVATGTSIRFYPVRGDLSPDWEWLDANRAPGDSALMLVHYYGFPNDIERAVEYCRYAAISLIENCAHSFLSNHGGTPLGSTGDIVVFSYRKILPARTGAGLYSSAGLVAPNPAPNPANNVTWVLRQILKWTVFKSGSAKVRRNFTGATTEAGRYERVTSAAIDPVSRRIMQRAANDLKDIRERRQLNYRTLLSLFDEVDGITFMRPDLGGGDCPWAMPIFVERRDDLLETLETAGVGAWAWPHMPTSVSPTLFANEHDLARRSVLLPIHQDLNPHHMRYIGRTVSNWASKNL
jgi:dTDP-4-amino-4,6-dideoxygalactose transaminase